MIGDRAGRLPGLQHEIADYSSVGGDLAAPGGDYFSASDTVQDAIIGALPNTPSLLWDAFDPLEPDLPGLTVVDQGDVCVPQRHLDGRSARGWCRRTDPPAAPELVTRRSGRRPRALSHTTGVSSRLAATE